MKRLWGVLIVTGLALALTGLACSSPARTVASTNTGGAGHAQTELGGRGGAEEHSGEAVKVEILLGEFYFQVEGQEKNAPIHLHAGTKYELEFKNVGTMLHEAAIGKEVKYEGDQPDGYQENLLEDLDVDIEGHMVIDGEEREFEIEAEGLEEIELEQGVELEVKFTLPADRVGEWEIGCFVPGHYQSGMRAPVIVEE